MHDKAMRGVPWTLLTYGFNRGLLFLATVVLARLLTPEEFGVVALATFALLALALLSDAGIGPALVVLERLDGARARTALTLSIILGVLVGAFIAAVSPLVANLLDEPRLGEILAVLSLCVPCYAYNAFAEALLQREIDFRTRFYGQAVQAVSYAVSAVTLAALGAGVWSLVWSQIGSLVLQSAALAILVRPRVRPGFSREAAVELWHTGRGFMAQSWLLFTSQHVDFFAVGKVLGASALGFYSMAFRIASLTYFAVAEPVLRATFPAFARMREAGQDVGPAFLSNLRLIGLVTTPFGVMLSGAADPLVRTVFGTAWLPMIGPLTALGMVAAIRPVQAAVGWLLNATGSAGRQAQVQAVLLVALVPAVIVAAERSGTTAVAWVAVGWFVCQWTGVSFIAWRTTGVTFVHQFVALRPVLVGALPCWVAARATASALDGEAAVVALGASVLAGTAGYLAGVLVAAPDTPRWVRGQAQIMAGRAPAPGPG